MPQSTLKDVAKAAGVSPSTASRALQGSPRISEETRRIVSDAAEALGYRRNRAASALRSKRSDLVGLVLNNLVNASFHTIAEVVQKRLADEGYQLILGTTDADPETERRLIETLSAQGVDGVIVIGSGQNAAVTNRFIADGGAVVNLIRSSKDSSAPTVLANDQEGAYAATSHLISLGHREIGYIGGPEGTDSGSNRFAGYAGALAAAGIPVVDDLVVRGPFRPDFGGEAARVLLGRRDDMTALFVANHESAFGVLPVLADLGVRIPADLSLVCYEDIPWLSMWHPPITVVDNGPRQLGELAVDLLIQQMRGSSTAPGSAYINRTYHVGAQLIERASCAPPRH